MSYTVASLFLSKTSLLKLVSLLYWVRTGRTAEQEVMGIESVVLTNNFCSASDALLCNVDPPVWWHMLIKSTAGCPLYPNLLVSKWILNVRVCVYFSAWDFTSLCCNIFDNCPNAACVCIARLCVHAYSCLYLWQMCSRMGYDKHST